VNVLSLFSGIGGLDLGLQRAGMTIAGQVEIDPWCRKVLAKHWPEVPRHDDVRTCVQWWGDRPRPDLVCGGFPCQPVSEAGYQQAQDDPRWLRPAFADVIRRLRPPIALVENVPGLLDRGMGAVLGDLAALGYDTEWSILSACAMGAPHARERLFIVADASGERRQRRWQPAHQGSSLMAGEGLRDRYGRHWATEPRPNGVAYGLPGRVDRLRGIGNAVVPQVAEHIGRLILAADGNAADRGRAA
jgi:DNA (cytosine-5)-methyltransferase 1